MLNNNATSCEKFYNRCKVKRSTGVRNGKRVLLKRQVQPYPVESVEIVEWLLCVE